MNPPHCIFLERGKQITFTKLFYGKLLFCFSGNWKPNNHAPLACCLLIPHVPLCASLCFMALPTHSLWWLPLFLIGLTGIVICVCLYGTLLERYRFTFSVEKQLSFNIPAPHLTFSTSCVLFLDCHTYAVLKLYRLSAILASFLFLQNASFTLASRKEFTYIRYSYNNWYKIAGIQL